MRAVVTTNGRIETERVLVCCGIWGPRIGRMAGVPIPLAPVEHQLAWTTPLAELAGETGEIQQPILRHQDQDLYFRQRRDHYAVGGYGHEPVVVDPGDIRPHGAPDDMPASNPFDAAAFVPAWKAAVELVPALRQVEIASAINGMFSFTPDGFPLLGESDRLRGFWLAEAIWITHAGGAAKAIAQLMTDGRADLDLRESDVNRFDAYATTDAYVRERGAQQYREVYDVIHPLQPLEQPRPLAPLSLLRLHSAIWARSSSRAAAGRRLAGTRRTRAWSIATRSRRVRAGPASSGRRSPAPSIWRPASAPRSST